MKSARIIPVNKLSKESREGIIVSRFHDGKELESQLTHSHRHDYHSFLVVENNNVIMEIDFETYTLPINSIIYIHPSQVHRIIDISNASFYTLSIATENIRNEYLKLLEQSILPSQPLAINSTISKFFLESIALCQKLFLYKDNNEIFSSSLKDSCNSFIGLCVSQFLYFTQNKENINRYEIVTKMFRQLLELKFNTMNKPSDFATALNISSTYLRECVRSSTGLSVTEHIQNRIILEAKRLLYHTDKSVKEIGIILGYEDYSYFSRLFKKIVGMTALQFRLKNRNYS